MLVEAGGAGEDVEIEEMGEGEELHDDAIAMLFLIAEHNNPNSKCTAPQNRQLMIAQHNIPAFKSASRCQSNSAQ